MSFPVESEGRDWLVSRMDVIKLFEPVLRPTAIEDRHAIRGVVIDPGHGGSDNGAASRLGYEKNYSLDTAFRLESLLRDAGLKVVLTRRNDVFIDLYERAHIASLYPDYCFISLHYNSASPEAHGLETYCLSPRGAASTSSSYLTRADIQKLPGNDYDPVNILLASMVHSEIVRLNPGDSSADRGVKRARFVVIKQNVLPAILVEGGFVSNRMEAARVNQASYRQSLAEAIARGVVRFANVMGNRRMSLPSAQPAAQQPMPMAKTIPVAKPAPSGLKKESPRALPVAQHVAPKAQKVAATKSKKSHKKKGKHHDTAVATTTNASSSSSANSSSASSTSTSPDAADAHPPLGLAEPAAPTLSPGAEKAPPEPDEPPTVNTDESSKGSSRKSTSTP
jgi:N-acetylmuramoyl-L-alanine amidase